MNTIYLVEDNPDNADLVVDLLSEDFEVSRFVSAMDLLEFLAEPENQPPEIFILDISLPGMDGVALLKKLKKMINYKDVPALALTAHAMKDDQRRFLEAGFDGYMSKPITDEEALKGEINRLINSA